MSTTIPRLVVPRVPAGWDKAADPAAWPWESLPVLPPFVLADGSGPAEQQTRARVCYDSETLYVRFDCDDRDIWATCTQRDDPIYDASHAAERVAAHSESGDRWPSHHC